MSARDDYPVRQNVGRANVLLNKEDYRAAMVELDQLRGVVPQGGLQFESVGWHLRKFGPNVPPLDMVAKLFEEGGEFARAVIGLVEERPSRGDPVQEAAQVVLVLLSFFGRFHPDIDLIRAVRSELNRQLRNEAAAS